MLLNLLQRKCLPYVEVPDGLSDVLVSTPPYQLKILMIFYTAVECSMGMCALWNIISVLHVIKREIIPLSYLLLVTYR